MAAGAALGVLQAGVGIAGAMSGASQEAFKAKMDAAVARTNAAETDATYRADLNRQLSNIKAIRASAGMGTETPTFQNIIEENRDIGSENRRRQVVGYQQKQLMAEGDASAVMRLGFLKSAGIAVQGLGSAFS